MIKVLVKKQSNYPVSTPIIKKKVSNFFKKNGIVSDSEVSVAIVGYKKMLDLSKKYLKDNKSHNVLSFSKEELDKNFKYPPNGKIQLGEIVVCYPVAVEEAKKEGKIIDDKIQELLEHGALHLLGIHHK